MGSLGASVGMKCKIAQESRKAGGMGGMERGVAVRASPTQERRKNGARWHITALWGARSSHNAVDITC